MAVNLKQVLEKSKANYADGLVQEFSLKTHLFAAIYYTKTNKKTKQNRPLSWSWRWSVKQKTIQPCRYSKSVSLSDCPWVQQWDMLAKAPQPTSNSFIKTFKVVQTRVISRLPPSRVQTVLHSETTVQHPNRSICIKGWRTAGSSWGVRGLLLHCTYTNASNFIRKVFLSDVTIQRGPGRQPGQRTASQTPPAPTRK